MYEMTISVPSYVHIGDYFSVSDHPVIYGLKLILLETEATVRVDLLRLLFQRLQQHFGSVL